MCSHHIDVPYSEITARRTSPLSFRVTSHVEAVRIMVQEEHTYFRYKNEHGWYMKFKLAMSYQRQIIWGGWESARPVTLLHWNILVGSVVDLYHWCRDALKLLSFDACALTNNPRIADHRIQDVRTRTVNVVRRHTGTGGIVPYATVVVLTEYLREAFRQYGVYKVSWCFVPRCGAVIWLVPQSIMEKGNTLTSKRAIPGEGIMPGGG